MSRFKEFVEYSRNHDTDAVVSLFDSKAKVMIDGLPPVVGLAGNYYCLRVLFTITESILDKKSSNSYFLVGGRMVSGHVIRK